MLFVLKRGLSVLKPMFPFSLFKMVVKRLKILTEEEKQMN